MIYALDSNIIARLLKNDDTIYTKYDNVLNQGSLCVFPIIVYYEVKRGLLANDAKRKMELFENLCETVFVPEFTMDDAVVASEIYAYRKNRGLPVGDADILIASQCLTRGYTLVTNNTKHFEQIDGLKLEDWTQA